MFKNLCLHLFAEICALAFGAVLETPKLLPPGWSGPRRSASLAPSPQRRHRSWVLRLQDQIRVDLHQFWHWRAFYPVWWGDTNPSVLCQGTFIPLFLLGGVFILLSQNPVSHKPVWSLCLWCFLERMRHLLFVSGSAYLPVSISLLFASVDFCSIITTYV